MVARFATRLDAAGLFVLKIVYELGHRGFFNPESLLTRMNRRRVNTG
jgi:hypothetical protein